MGCNVTPQRLLTHANTTQLMFHPHFAHEGLSCHVRYETSADNHLCLYSSFDGATFESFPMTVNILIH
jgi:hypothetical protein